MDAALRLLKTVRLVLLVSMVLYVLLGEWVPHSSRPTGTLFPSALAIIATVMIVTVFAVRRVLIARQAAILAQTPSDPAALGRWRVGYMLIYVLSEALGLFGFIVRFLGFTLMQAAPFYAAGFLMVLFYVPARPKTTIG